VLRLPALVSGIAGAVVDVPVLDAEHRDVAFAVEGDVAGVLRRLGILRIGPDAVEHAVDDRGSVPSTSQSKRSTSARLFRERPAAAET
jgi:hypothetical protein